MIFRRAAIRELTLSTSAVFAALFAIMLTQLLMRLLKQAATGKLAPDALFALLGFGALNVLPTLLAVTVFIAVLITFSRWYRDSEMAIWLASGASLTQCVGVVLRFAWPLLVVISVLSFWVTPWANARSEAYRSAMEQRDDTSRITAGAFNESASGDRVFYVERVEGDTGKVGNVFVASEQAGAMTLIATASGHVETATNGDRFLVLEEGRRYDTHGEDASFRVMEFGAYGVRIESADASRDGTTYKGAATADLFSAVAKGAKAELLWRIGTPLSALVLLLLALPLAHANPRAGGRTSSVIAAILLYLIYNNLLNVSQVWVEKGKVDFLPGMLGAHLLMLLVTLALFGFRRRPLSWRRLLWR